MTFAQAITICFRKYATFSGRASKSEFWWYMGAFIPCATAAISSESLADLSEGPYTTILVLFFCLLVLPTSAVFCRRLHDINLSGKWVWWIVIPIAWLILAAFFVALSRMGWSQGGVVALVVIFVPLMVPLGPPLLIVAAIIILGLFCACLFPGTPRTNRFGSVPTETEPETR